MIAIFGLFGSFIGFENLLKSKGFTFSAPGIFGMLTLGSFGILKLDIAIYVTILS